MIELTHASFQYENSDRGVQDISILVKSGECVVLTGLSGCGKTTVTRLVNGLAPSYYPGAFSGSVRILLYAAPREPRRGETPVTRASAVPAAALAWGSSVEHRQQRKSKKAAPQGAVPP